MGLSVQFDQSQFTLSTFAFLKADSDNAEEFSKGISIQSSRGGQSGRLVPIQHKHLESAPLIATLSHWRNSAQFAYPTRFHVTETGTKRWLKDSVLESPGRVLFLIQTNSCSIIGHIGLLLTDEGLEIDNVLRGTDEAPGIMAAAMSSLEEYSYLELGYTSVYLKVLQSNRHAQEFYKKILYTVQREIPLTKLIDEESEKLIEDPNGTDDAFLVCTKNLLDVREDSQRVLTAGPSIGPREQHYVFNATTRGWNQNHSDYIHEFESRFAQELGVKHAISTSSCTGALHLSLLALNIQPGDEVIVPDITWVATAAAVDYCGAKPVFADVDKNTWCISPTDLEKAITKKTKAIIPVHLYGNPADMTAVMEIAHHHGIHVVEDAAPAIGARHAGSLVGTIGDIGCFSFQGAKLLVTGEGGMAVTNDDFLASRIRKIQDHGRRPGTFWIDEVGRKYKMSNVTAALGLGQFEKTSIQIEQKRRINNLYREILGSCDQIAFQEEEASSFSICWMSSIRIERNAGITREELCERLSGSGIDTRPSFPQLSQFEMWRSKFDPRSNASTIAARGINLPSGVALSARTIERIGTLILAELGHK